MALEHSNLTGVDRAAIAAVAQKCLADACSADAQNTLSRLYEADLDMDEIVAMIERQPTLALRVLKVANGALYSHLGNASTIERAVLVLGMEAVRGVVAAVCLNRRLYSSSSSRDEPDALYSHCLATAMASRELARRCRPELAGQAFLAGLVHDIGSALLERANHDGWRRMLGVIDASRETTCPPVHDLEIQMLGVGHSQCAAIAFDTWRLPPWLGEVVAAHHFPLAAAKEYRDLTTILYVANEICIRAGLGPPHERNATEFDSALLQTIELGQDDIEMVLATVAGARATLADELDS